MPYAELWDTGGQACFEIKNCFGHATRYPNEDAEEAAGFYNYRVSGEVIIIIIIFLIPISQEMDYGGSVTSSTSNIVWLSRSLEVPG